MSVSGIDSIILTVAPQFTTITNRADFISLAACQVNRCFFGNNADYATALMASHLIALTPDGAALMPGGGGSGAVVSKREGDLSITFGTVNTSGMNAGLAQTPYGIQFAQLQSSGGVFLSVTGGGGACGAS